MSPWPTTYLLEAAMKAENGQIPLDPVTEILLSTSCQLSERYIPRRNPTSLSWALRLWRKGSMDHLCTSPCGSSGGFRARQVRGASPGWLRKLASWREVGCVCSSIPIGNPFPEGCMPQSGQLARRGPRREVGKLEIFGWIQDIWRPD